MKKILLIHNIFWSHYKAIVFSELAELLKGRYDWKVLQIALTERSRQNLGTIDYSIHRYPYEVLFNSTYQETSMAARYKKIVQQIRAFNPDIVVLPGYNDPAYVLVMLYVKLKGLHLITTADSTEYDHPRVWHREAFKRLVLKMPDIFLCYGTRAKDYLRQLGIGGQKIFIRVQATDNELYRKKFLLAQRSQESPVTAGHRRNFIYVGRLLKSKQVDMLISAFAGCMTADDQTAEWGLQIVGVGEELERLRTLASALNVARHAHFVGAVSWGELPSHYAKADVFVFPSASETWGLVMNEAMLCELPVLASTHCGATADLVIDGVNGYAFHPGDTGYLTTLMLKFIRNEADARKMGQASLRIIEEFTPKKAAAQMLHAFDSLGRPDGRTGFDR